MLPVCCYMLPKSYCQALTATRQPADGETGGRFQGPGRSSSRCGATGPATLKAIPLMWMRPWGWEATAVRWLVQHFSITFLCNGFCSHFPLSLPISLSFCLPPLSLLFYLCCRYNTAGFLSGLYLLGCSAQFRGEIKRITYKALRLFQ